MGEPVMRRSIQIVSAYAFLMAAAGPVTGFSDGLAAEGEKLPCNNFCRTWMGFEAGEATAPQAAPAEAVTVKPTGVSRDPESSAESPAPDSAKSKSASKIDAEGKPTHPKPKHKAAPDVADVSDHRSTARPKTGTLAKNPKLDRDTASETRSGSESSKNRAREQAEENVKTSSRDRDETSSEPAKVTGREVPLPPRLPRAARPSRTGVAQAGPHAADDMRAGASDGEPARSTAASKALRSVKPAQNPDAAQADVPPPAIGGVASATSTTKSRTVGQGSTGAVGDGGAARHPSLAGQTVTPAVDLGKDASRVAPPTEHPHRALAESAEARAKHTPADGLATTSAPSPASRAVAPATDPDQIAAGVASQAAGRPQALTTSGDAADKHLPNVAGKGSAVAADSTAAARPASSEGSAVPAAADRDTVARTASQTVAPPALAAPGESDSKIPADANITGSTPPVPAARLESPAGRAVASASGPDTNAGRVASQVEGRPQALAPTTPSAAKPPELASGGRAVALDGSAASGSPPPAGRAVAPPFDPAKDAARIASPVVASSPASAGSGEAAAKVASIPVDKERAVVVDRTATSGSPSLEGRVVAPASDADKHAAPVASQAEAAAPGLAGSGEAASPNPPTSAGQRPAVAAEGPAAIVSPFPPARGVASAPDAEEQVAPVASPAVVPYGASADAGQNPQNTPGNEPLGGEPAASPETPSVPAAAPSGTPAIALKGLSVPVPEPAPIHPTGDPVAAMNASPRSSDVVPRALQNPPASADANREAVPDLGRKEERPAPVASNQTKGPVGGGYGALKSIDEPHRAPPGETASIAAAPLPGTGSVDDNPATLVTIAIGDVSAEPEGTTIAYTITNPASAPVDLLFIRCNAVDPKGAIVGSAFDYVENIPAGQRVKRSVRLPSDLTTSGQTFSCANDAATQ